MIVDSGGMASLLDVEAALAREKKERRNLARRKSFHEKQHREAAYERLLVEGKEACQKLIESAESNAAKIVEDARIEAKSLLESNNIACVQLMERRDSLRRQLARHEAMLYRQQRNVQDCRMEVDAEAAAQFRRKEAARKRDAYWKNKSQDELDADEAVADDGDDNALPNRKRTSIDHVLSWASRTLLCRLKHFNDQSKKLFFERFWKHRSLKRFQPKSIGMHATVGAAVVDMKQTLSIIKTAKRKDHLATKHALLTALVGQTTVQNRHQSSLAKALGIKRGNLCRASKRRKLIDDDLFMKYPMGERKVRSDKISDAVRLIVERYWESNTRISPCTKDKAQLRLARKKYEEHRIHWLEETEVEFFLRFQDWCEKEDNGIDIGLRHRQDAMESLESAVGKTVRMALDEDKTRDVIADYHFYISDDNKHDTLFVQHCMDLHYGWMKGQGIHVEQHWVWSDGAASQFKSCRPFYYVSRYYHHFGARMKWFFHASGHGKGVADGLGGHIKQGIQREQLKGIQGAKLDNAHDVVKFCEDKFALGQEKEYGDVQLVRRLFWEIPLGDVNRNKKWDCDPIKGSRKLHCFDGFSSKLSTLLQVRELCCFCPHCVDDDYTACENKAMVGQFRFEMIQGVLPGDVKQEVLDLGVGEGGKDREGSLGELVQVGDFYAVEAALPNKWNASFYIMQCEVPVHSVNESFIDGYDQAFKKGDEVVKGRWFQPQPGRELKYVYNNKSPFGYDDPKSIVHIRFGLTPCEAGKGGKGGARVYLLDGDTFAAISESLGEFSTAFV
ncbi:unnamed protein product [Calypogeia fissa]